MNMPMTKKPKAADDTIRHKKVTMGSNRSFGVVFTLFFSIIALWPLLNSNQIRIWAIITALIFLLASLFAPTILAPLNKVWFKFGLLLHHIVNPIIMAVMYFIVFAPVALVLKIMKKDLLRLRLDKKATTYWVERKPPGPEPESMRNQF